MQSTRTSDCFFKTDFLSESAPKKQQNDQGVPLHLSPVLVADHLIMYHLN